MTKDEALKLALEALENHCGNYKLDDAGCERWNKAVAAIKEALAQPEQGCNCNQGQCCHICDPDIVNGWAQPEQGPVAWEQFYPDIGKPQLRQEPSITKTGCGILTLHLGFDDLPDGTKFYTTPPKQEPRNFCPRCGKRTADLTVIHTCTPPEGGHQ